jgi:hypothetical protein
MGTDISSLKEARGPQAAKRAFALRGGHLGGGSGLINEDKLFRIKGWRFSPQSLTGTGRGDVGRILFGCMETFLNVRFWAGTTRSALALDRCGNRTQCHVIQISNFLSGPPYRPDRLLTLTFKTVPFSCSRSATALAS